MEGPVEQRPGTLEERDACVVGGLLQELARQEKHAGVDQACLGGPPFIPPPVPLHPQKLCLCFLPGTPFLHLAQNEEDGHCCLCEGDPGRGFIETGPSPGPH